MWWRVEVAVEGGCCRHTGGTGTVAGIAGTVDTDAFVGSTPNKTWREQNSWFLLLLSSPTRAVLLGWRLEGDLIFQNPGVMCLPGHWVCSLCGVCSCRGFILCSRRCWQQRSAFGLGLSEGPRDGVWQQGRSIPSNGAAVSFVLCGCRFLSSLLFC